jgi:hypothetical protein
MRDERIMKRATELVFRKTKKVLHIRVLQNLPKRFPFVGAKPLVMLSALSTTRIDEAPLEVFRLLLLDFPPADDLGQNNPAVIFCEFSAERQEKIARRDHLARGSLIQTLRLHVHDLSRANLTFLKLDFTMRPYPLVVLSIAIVQ